jgi:hypothetical protein
MFEQEIEMEQRQSSVVPLLLIILMIVAFVGVAAYYVVQNQKVLPATEASNLIATSLKEGGPVTIQFRTGMVIASVAERPHGPNYRLLEKAGLLNIGKDKGRATPVTLNGPGPQTDGGSAWREQEQRRQGWNGHLCRSGGGASALRNAADHHDGHGSRKSGIYVGVGRTR